MISRIHFIVLLLIAVNKVCDCDKLASLERTYHKGVAAYSDERWSLCIEKFEESLHLYKLYRSIINNCRIKCNSQIYDSQLKEDIDDLKTFETYFIKRKCLVKCKERDFHNMKLDKNLSETVFHYMWAKKPYDYLHICYYQMHMFPKAASAAYTYLMINPEDERLKSNVQYYLELPEVDAMEVFDLESEVYVVMYRLGRKSYSMKNWAETVANMEEVLRDYFVSENNCRVECEHLPGQEWSSEYVITMSNLIASLLHCRQQCQNKLKSLKQDSGVQFICDVLNYLQASYYYLEKYTDSAEAVGSYLALMPNDENMLDNLIFYSKFVDKKAFTQRSEIVHYMKRDLYEKKLLTFFHQENKSDLIFDAVHFI